VPEEVAGEMTEYYFDLETYVKETPDPTRDKIITIQYQRLSMDGRPDGELTILTEKEYGSEKAILEAFKPTFLTDNKFDFIPVGVNLYGYDLICLVHRLNHYFDLGLGFDFLRDKPAIDVKSTLVMMNRGRFEGYQKLLGKTTSGSVIRAWYEVGDWPRILRYVKEEAELFTGKYQVLRQALPKVFTETG